MGYVTGKYRAARRLGSFARYLTNWRDAWQAFKSGRPAPVLHLRGGLTIAGGPEDDLFGIFHEIFVARCYTSGFYWPQSGDVVIDVGGNIGVFAVFMAWLAPDTRVHSFEPLPSTRARLEENVRSNHLGDRITVHPEAVADRLGTITLRSGATAGHTSVVTSSFTSEVETILPCLDLAAALARAAAPRVAFLKVDVEGSEVEVFSALRPNLLHHVERVAVEYHGLFRPGSREAVVTALRAAGYDMIEDRVDLPDGRLGLIRAARSARSGA